MNGFDNIKERVKLRQQFKDETGDNWENSQGEPDIDYVLWLENKALSIANVVATEGKCCGYFSPVAKHTSATICETCGQEKHLHPQH